MESALLAEKTPSIRFPRKLPYTHLAFTIFQYPEMFGVGIRYVRVWLLADYVIRQSNVSAFE